MSSTPFASPNTSPQARFTWDRMGSLKARSSVWLSRNQISWIPTNTMPNSRALAIPLERYPASAFTGEVHSAASAAILAAPSSRKAENPSNSSLSRMADISSSMEMPLTASSAASGSSSSRMSWGGGTSSEIL